MPVLGTVDYSPIISSLNARGRAGQANISERYEDLKQQEKTRQAVAGTIDGAFKLAGTVVGLIEQADLEKNKSKVVDFQVEAAKRIDNAIATGQWEYDENGNLQITSDFADWYKQQRDSLAGEAKTTKVRRWMQDQVDGTYQNLSTQATGMLVRRQAQETNAALEDTIANEMTIALDTGDFSPIEASINSNPFWTDTFKAQRLQQAKDTYSVGLMTKQGTGTIESTGDLKLAYDAIDQYQGDTITDAQRGAAKQAVEVEYKRRLNGYQAEADTAIKALADQGAPMGTTTKALVDKAPEGMRADLQKYVDERRDAAMWEQFQQKANAPGADLMRLYHQIKGDEPGKSGYTGHYEGAQVEQTRELNYLAGFLGLEKQEGSKATDKWVDDKISGIETAVFARGISIEEGLKMLTSSGVFDLSPQKANASVQKLLTYKSPELGNAYKNMDGLLDTVVKQKKMKPEQANMLRAVMYDTVTQSFYDNPKMNSGDYAKLQNDIVNAVVGASSDALTELAQPGWIKSSDDKLAVTLNELEKNPTLSGALIYTEPVFDSFSNKSSVNVVMNPFVKPRLEQLADRGRTLTAERLGISPDEVNQSWKAEGAWDQQAIPQYTARIDGKVRTFVMTGEGGKLGLVETTDGKRELVKEPAKPPTTSAPPPSGVVQSADLTTISKDTVQKYMSQDISAKWDEATKGIIGRERMALPTTKEAQIRWLINKGVLSE